MAEVQIKCPTCGNNGEINVSEELLKSISRGLLAINVQKTICEHSFIVYIDKNLTIRDYFIADYHLELPELITSKPETEKIQVFCSGISGMSLSGKINRATNIFNMH